MARNNQARAVIQSRFTVAERDAQNFGSVLDRQARQRSATPRCGLCWASSSGEFLQSLVERHDIDIGLLPERWRPHPDVNRGALPPRLAARGCGHIPLESAASRAPRSQKSARGSATAADSARPDDKKPHAPGRCFAKCGRCAPVADRCCQTAQFGVDQRHQRFERLPVARPPAN